MEKVSVYMLAYNHSKWIARAIESIINQKTNFEYKLYIYDDASNDGTINIINEYSKKYPNLIVPILQKKNVYSKDGFIGVNKIILPYIKGKYVCLCEGDDYWISDNKLQIQYDYMEKNSECSFCFSNAFMVDTEDNYISDFFNYYWKDCEIVRKLKKESDFNTEEILRIGFTPTASGMMTYNAYYDWVNSPFQIDLLLRLISTELGYAHFFPMKMTAYRTGNNESASGRASGNFEKYYNDFYKYHARIYDYFNEKTNGKYSKTISLVKKREIVLVYIRFLNKKNYSEFLKLECYKDLRIYRKIRYLFKILLKG